MLSRFYNDERFSGILTGPLWPILASNPYYELGSFKMLHECFSFLTRLS